MSSHEPGRPAVGAGAELARRLRLLRRGRGLAQRDLCGPLQLASHSAIVDYESGRRIPAPDIIAGYERFFRVSDDSLKRLRAQALAERANDEHSVIQPSHLNKAVPRQTPASSGFFTGRTEQLKALGDLAATINSPGASPVIVVIDGPAGIGKTALAVRFAQTMRDQFPDGQLYIDLRGFGPDGDPYRPVEVLGLFLEALSVPAARLPAGLDARAGLFRSALADRRMLILLDNACDVAQVRPLLPGSPTCLVVVTSRCPLIGLVAAVGAHPITLDLLGEAEAYDLMVARLGPENAIDRPAITELIGLCGRLPLALNIAAARAVTESSLAHLVAELRDLRKTLAALDTGDPLTDLRTVFSSSYHRLSSPGALMFRLLSSHPKPNISTRALTALAGSGSRTTTYLSELRRLHLVEEPEPGRYALHDLLRTYAIELSTAQDPQRQRDAALSRLFDYYLHSAHDADRMLNPHRRGIPLSPPAPHSEPESFGTIEQGIAWYEREWPTIADMLRETRGPQHDGQVWRLAWNLASFFLRQGLTDEWIDTQRTALAAAKRTAEPDAQARIHTGLSRAYIATDRPDQAEHHAHQALSIYRELDDHVGQGRVSLSLNMIYANTERHDQALDYATKALAIFQRAADEHGQASAHNAIGWYHALHGHVEPATVHCRTAIEIFRTLEDRVGEAAAWDTLGRAHLEISDYEKSVTHYRHAITLLNDAAAPRQQANVLDHLADALQRSGDDRAAAQARKAAHTFRATRSTITS